MDVPLRMPDLATTGAAIKVLRWLVQPGCAVRRGQPILEVETDKAVMEVEAAAEGVVKALVAAEGAELDAGQTIAILESEGSAAKAGVEPPAMAAPAASVPAQATRRRASGSAGRTSFFARNRERRARQEHRRLAAIASPDAATESLLLSIPQKVAARRMAESKRTVPHFYLQTSADAGPMVARRNAAAGKLLWDAFFVRAAGKALRAFERMRFRYEDDQLIAGPGAAVALAVDVEGDLFTLTVHDPAPMTLESISREIAAGVERLRAGDPEARVARPACLTVSNLGGSGVESFAAVINPPESAILAVGKIMPVAAVVEGQITVQDRVQLTLSVDHRVAGGKYAAGFLNAIVRELESIGGDEE